jgi:hypothetical protein
MKWCLRVKLAQNWGVFGNLLLATGDYPIVEDSRKDDYWGAKNISDDTLSGQNVLGRLLMELREKFKRSPESLTAVDPLPLPRFTLMEEPISAIYAEVFGSPILGQLDARPPAMHRSFEFQEGPARR